MKIRIIMAAALLIGVMPSLVSAQNKTVTYQRWIEGLKATPVAKFEAGMPEKPLGEWLVANAKASEVQYVVEPCTGKGPLCIRVTSWKGWVVLRFVLDGTNQGGDPQAAKYRFWFGWEGPPPGSSMKRPDRYIFKLSDLRTKLHWE